MNPAVISPEAPTPMPSRTCTRCGAFLPEDSKGAECVACGDKLRAERLARKLYPTWYIVTFGVVVNFTVAGVLAALNWRTLGERTRERMAWGIAVMGVVVTAVALMKGSRMGLRFASGLVGTLVAAQGLGPVYKAHREAGGKRASLLAPLGILIGALVLGIVLLGFFGPDEWVDTLEP